MSTKVQESIAIMQQDVQQSFDEIRKLFRETDERLAKELRERDERMNLLHQEMVVGFQKLRELFKETDQKIRELADLFTSQWGKLIEALVEPGSVRIFQERGIGVTGSCPRMKQPRNGT
jgi:malate synthase